MTITSPGLERRVMQENPVVLVVEDSPDVREMLGAQLRFFKFSPICMEDGQTALDWLAHNRADLIILDLMLPVLDGIAICKRIRAQHSPADLPILMLSALGIRADDRLRGLEAGANDFMAKPYEIEELAARLRILMNVKSEKQRAQEPLLRYVAPAVRAQVQTNPKTLKRQQIRQAAILFADLRGYTHLSNQTDLFSLTGLLNEFFVAMMALVNRQGGLVLDLTGDELLAVFNGPHRPPAACRLAVDTAVKMQRLFTGLQQRWMSDGYRVGLGIGIHHGKVMEGNIGGEELMRYTVTGSVVNMAHRLVEIAEGGEIMISADVYAHTRSSMSDLQYVAVPSVELKGIANPQMVYKLCVDDSRGS